MTSREIETCRSFPRGKTRRLCTLMLSSEGGGRQTSTGGDFEVVEDGERVRYSAIGIVVRSFLRAPKVSVARRSSARTSAFMAVGMAAVLIRR